MDAQVAKVRDAFGDRLPDGEAQALKEVNGLEPACADTIEQSYLPADNIDPAYTNATEGLIDGLGLDRNADLAATFTGNLLDSLLRADAAHGSFETGVFSATTGDTNALIEFTSAVGSYELYTHQAERFARFATEAAGRRARRHRAQQLPARPSAEALRRAPDRPQHPAGEHARREIQARRSRRP